VKVRSSDNDGAGIVFRYVDATHYYLFYVRPETHVAKIYKRDDNGFTTLGSATTQIAWSSTTDVSLEVRPRDYNFTGYINGTQVVTGSDVKYPTGLTGIHKWKLTSASFDDFTVTPKPPATTGNWPAP